MTLGNPYKQKLFSNIPAQPKRIMLKNDQSDSNLLKTDAMFSVDSLQSLYTEGTEKTML
jgi:hypothetical protein